MDLWSGDCGAATVEQRLWIGYYRLTTVERPPCRLLCSPLQVQRQRRRHQHHRGTSSGRGAVGLRAVGGLRRSVAQQRRPRRQRRANLQRQRDSFAGRGPGCH